MDVWGRQKQSLPRPGWWDFARDGVLSGYLPTMAISNCSRHMTQLSESQREGKIFWEISEGKVGLKGK